jgi:choline dehydrogenase-like flavoprotein
MIHPETHYGLILLSDPNTPRALYGEPFVVRNMPIMGVLTLAETTLRREKLGNFCVQLKPAQGAPEGSSYLGRLWESLTNGRLPGRPIAALLPRIQLEQAPDPNSRATLGPDRDALGRHRLRLDFRLSTIAKHSVVRGMEIIGQQLGRAGLGRLRIPGEADATWFPGPVGSGHHIGTTRMHLDPKQGVVDANCQVHGIANLFVAGSSVFPTAGYANPTLTIVALALRLADHVKGRLTRSSPSVQ